MRLTGWRIATQFRWGDTYFSQTVRTSNRILINGIRSATRFHSIFCSFYLFAFLEANLRGIKVIAISRTIISISIPMQRAIVTIISKYPLTASGHAIPISTIDERTEKTAHSNGMKTTTRREEEKIAQLFGLPLKKWQLFVCIVDRANCRQSNGCDKDTNWINFLCHSAPIDFVKLNFDFLFSFHVCLCLQKKTTQFLMHKEIQIVKCVCLLIRYFFLSTIFNFFQNHLKRWIIKFRIVPLKIAFKFLFIINNRSMNISCAILITMS